MGFTAGSGRPTPIEPPKPTPPPMSGGKGAGRVSPVVESRPVFQDLRDNPGLDNPVFRGLVQRQNKERFQPVLDNAFQQAATFPTELRTTEEDMMLRAKAQEAVEKELAQKQAGTITAPPPTPSGGGGKGSGMVRPIVESRPMFQNQKEEFAPELRPYINSLPGVSAAPQPILPQPVLGQQLSEQPQQSITGMNTNTGSTNSIPAPQSAIFKQGGLIGLMRRR